MSPLHAKLIIVALVLVYGLFLYAMTGLEKVETVDHIQPVDGSDTW